MNSIQEYLEWKIECQEARCEMQKKFVKKQKFLISFLFIAFIFIGFNIYLDHTQIIQWACGAAIMNQLFFQITDFFLDKMDYRFDTEILHRYKTELLKEQLLHEKKYD